MRLRRGCERHVRQPEREIERAELRHAHGTMYITLGPCRPDVTLALRMKARWLGRHAVVWFSKAEDSSSSSSSSGRHVMFIWK